MSAVVIVIVAVMASFVPGCARALLARMSGMRVTRLVIGLGPTVASRPLGRTRLQLCAVPIGAFSQVAGLHATHAPVVVEPIVDDGARRIGVQLGFGPAVEHVPVARAIVDGLRHPFAYVGFIAESLTKRSTMTMSGPVGIATVLHKRAGGAARLFVGV